MIFLIFKLLGISEMIMEGDDIKTNNQSANYIKMRKFYFLFRVIYIMKRMPAYVIYNINM